MRQTALKFKMSEPNVRLIQSGKTWKPKELNRRVFSREEVDLIRTTPKSARILAAEFNVMIHVIDRIRIRKTYKYYGQPAGNIEDGA